MSKFTIILVCIISAVHLLSGNMVQAKKTPTSAGIDGKRAAQKLWKKEFAESCRNIFDFEKRAEKKLINGKFAYENNDSWNTKAYKTMAKKAVKSFVSKLQKKCMDPKHCKDLGKAAAGIIASEFCNPGLYVGHPSMKYPAHCRKVAIKKCKGSMYTLVKKEKKCRPIQNDIKNLTSKHIKKLKLKCSSEVDELIAD